MMHLTSDLNDVAVHVDPAAAVSAACGAGDDVGDGYDAGGDLDERMMRMMRRKKTAVISIHH